jgi:hypothetical protein
MIYIMWQLGTCSSYYPNGVLLCPFVVGWHGIRKRRFNSRAFWHATWKTCKRRFFLWTQALASNLNSILIPQHDFLAHKHLLCNLCRNPSFGLATKARGCKVAGVKTKEARESKGRKPRNKGKGIGRVRAKRKPGSHHILPGV